MAQSDENPGRGATGTGKFPPSGMRAAGAGPGTGEDQPPYGARPGTHPQADASSGEALRANSVFLGFAPWIIFDVVASPSTWKYAALATGRRRVPRG